MNSAREDSDKNLSKSALGTGLSPVRLACIAHSRPSGSSATRSIPASVPHRPVPLLPKPHVPQPWLYIGSLVRDHLQTCSNCLPRTLGSGSRRANRSPNVPTAGMLVDG